MCISQTGLLWGQILSVTAVSSGLAALSLSESGEQKSATIILKLSISPFNSVRILFYIMLVSVIGYGNIYNLFLLDV